MLELILVLFIAIFLAWCLGKYLSKVMANQPMWGDGLFRWIENPVYRLLGISPQQQMNWKQYSLAFVVSCIFLAVAIFAIFMTQAWLPLNPNHAPNMSWDLALHTVISFLTNTNQQHYSGQAQLSYLSQMTGIVGLQVITPMMGLALVVATLRAFFYQRPSHIAADVAEQPDQILIGNYWADVIRPTVRFLLPLCFVWSLLLNSQGVPSTFQSGPEVQLIDKANSVETQKIPLGPVAPMVAIKQLGSNGGGWYGPNSSVPLENPTPFSNLLEMVAILLIPITVIFMVGHFIQRKKFAYFVFGSMFFMSIISGAAAVWSESMSATASQFAVMEGKEQRFGPAASTVWAALTTQVNNGSVNMMHDSSAPLTGLVELINMLINAIWGGVGCGLQQFMIYLLLAVFIAGLMTGRTPELFGRKIEAAEIKLLAIIILIQPLVILAFTALSLSIPGISGISNPGPHGISQVLYEYVSAFANNGSGFEGLGDNTIWWNVTCSIALLLGRFPTLILPLMIATRLAAKRKAPETAGSLQVETPTFALTLITIVVLLTLLQFMPVLVLGPIADQLLLVKG
ncbi:MULTISPECIES: potassium-transporting ATPase subunit KdpA [Acinetobacter]|uniref:Potassium-transporting ATPase potassium-binding subunit n=1 Tax=Acinetobacter pittii TaxID=48296 RepID=A0A242U1Y7_ACIPI|nr:MULTISPECIES: potassium-transporting ATPase subunit KdpA [Acinetobacter]MBJ8471736.1 potassium-transporting ATPase subunit KdpA [Acinetobacter pittii]MBJ8500110.1 potassium-transporting ATPase subunit KdpA [Acinetobacter pittii]MBJ9890852.1 potassium-transporting ATPase subunit KdpA [Acinetobacter pittii]MCU4477394.1 potassium-transporting ATPase subunit KdpA [Acinetobacter sp. WU_MDCI_Abxd143]MDN4020744.1 potassium-transporting ATPase subunit KdpA [Acinetobacter pittii]